jgi:phosphonate transport system substrate-binding protein
VRAHEQCGAVPIVRLNTGDSPTIQSFIMVRDSSPIRSLDQLDGKRFGFGSPLSTTSHLAPRAMLKAAGLYPGANVDCHYFEHHEKAARAVLLGQVDACGVRDTVGRRFEERGLRVIARSSPIENFPIVVSSALAESVGSELLHALVEAPRSNASLARKMLSWDPEISSGFRPVKDEDYDGVRELAWRVFGEDALTMSADETRCAP